MLKHLKQNVIVASLTLVVLALVSASAFAGGENAAGSLFDAVKSINSVDAEFKQVISDRAGNVVQESGGDLSLARPNLIYWKTAPPYEQEIIGDGETIWVYDPDLEQVTQYAGGDLLQGPMALFSSSIEDLERQFLVSFEARKVGSTLVERYTLDARVSAVDESVKSLVFEFVDAKVSAIEIHDKLQQRTVISLSDVVVNAELDPERFQFTPPTGVDVLVNE